MATLVSSKFQNIYHQQPYLSSCYGSQPIPNNYYQQYPQKKQQQQQQQTRITTVEYINPDSKTSRPRREPRIHRQVIILPTPEPVYRQVRHRLPTPERQVIQRMIIQKANGDVVVQQERPKKKARIESRSETTTQRRSSRSRQVIPD